MLEILAPSGNEECAEVAIANGADAIYLGYTAFSARDGAENFDDEGLLRILRKAHFSGVKVYVAMNTAVKEKELNTFLKTLIKLWTAGVDAIIMQDLLLGKYVHSLYPEIVLHASTQAGICSEYGAKLAKEYGFSRVILARETPLAEIAKITKIIETEVFVQGALCTCFSGQCYFSSFVGGNSGNRGRCKQPCRRAFSGKNGSALRILSPADLAGNSLLEELDKLKIASLKIEGRLRTPDYIWKTARAYRILLDNPGDPAAVKEAENIFRTVPGRKKSTGFYFQSDWKKLVDPAESGAFGECAAKVEKVIRAGMTVKILSSLHLGDRLRVMPPSGGEGESFTLATLENRRKEKLIRGRSGETLFIPGSFRAAPGHEIRRIGENGFDFSRRAAALPGYRRLIGLKLAVSAQCFRAEIPRISGIWECRTDFLPAEKHPLEAQNLQDIFSAGTPEGFAVKNVDVSLDGRFFVPAGTLKSLRRSCWEFFAPLLVEKDFFADHPEKMENFYAETHPQNSAEIRSISTLPENIFIVPPFVPETELIKVSNDISNAYTSGCRDFAATGWHAFEMLKKYHDITIHAVYPFHISNSFAVKLAAELGADTVAVTPECEESSAELLKQNSPLPVIKDKAPVPLLVSRLPLAKGVWRSIENRAFKIEERDGISYLYGVKSP